MHVPATQLLPSSTTGVAATIVALGIAVSVSVVACMAFVWHGEIDPEPECAVPVERAPEALQPTYQGDSAVITTEPSTVHSKWM